MDEKNMFLTLPPYREIPDVGLYLNQVVKYLTDCVGGCPGISITDSMVMGLNKLWELVMYMEAWGAVVHEVKSDSTDTDTERELRQYYFLNF